jgi:glyoxylase-like metal-dependent hydrolase (beta-lactamase superfamily II)
MQEIRPGIWHWTSFRETIGQDVSSYWIEPAGIVLDPMVPPGPGLDWWDGRDVRPQQLVLTIGLHWRESDEFRRRFPDIPVRCASPALERFEGTDRQAEGFEFGDEVAPGVTAVEVGGIAPDETALHIEHGGGAIAIADGLIRASGGGPLSFVPDFLMGDDPETVKAALIDSFRGLLTRDFDTLLFAHGEPLVGGAKTTLRDFVESHS